MKSISDILNSESFKALREAMQQYENEFEKDSNDWWESLSYEEKTKAFYSVVKRIHQADVIDRGSYRYALYGVFGFEPDMYALGMSSGYMEIHNLIYSAIEDDKHSGE